MEKCYENVKIIGFFDIILDILNKLKDNLGEGCVKGGLLSFQGKFETIAPDFPGKIFSSFDPTFRLSFPKIWLSHPHKNYKIHNVMLKTIRLVAI